MAKLELHKDGIAAVDMDWGKRVLEPTQAGHFIEAFAAADAIIDDSIEMVLRQIYQDHSAQNLINELHQLRGRTSFDGMTILMILKNKNLVGDELYKKVLKFKEKRNLVLHNVEAEYKLLDSAVVIAAKEQADLDSAAKLEAQKWLQNAYTIFIDLLNISEIVHGQDPHLKTFIHKKN